MDNKFRRTSVKDSFSVPSNLIFAKTTFRISLSFSIADFSHILSEKRLKRGGLLCSVFTLLYCFSLKSEFDKLMTDLESMLHGFIYR